VDWLVVASVLEKHAVSILGAEDEALKLKTASFPKTLASTNQLKQ
jgi:hypothetical protein